MSHIKPAVSIGMPVYNGERFIREALDSLLAQSFIDFELIISDNASTDSTESICRYYAEQDSRIRYVQQLKNIGALPNFQYVLNEARGECFMWAACDDKWDENWIALLQKKLMESKNSAVFGKLSQIDENSLSLEHPAIHNSLQYAGGKWMRRAAFFIEFEGFGKANLFYALFKRNVLLGIDLATYESDYLVLFDLLLKVQFISIENVCLQKRIHATSDGSIKSKTIGEKIFEIVTLKFLWRNFFIATSYLNHAEGGEWMLLAALIPIKIFNSHYFYARSMLNKLFASNQT